MSDPFDLSMEEASARIESAMRVPVFQVAYRVPISREMLADMPDMASAQRLLMRRMFEPWAFPDRNPMPQMVPLPLLEAVMRLPARARATRRRLQDAWLVLTGRQSIWEDPDA